MYVNRVNKNRARNANSVVKFCFFRGFFFTSNVCCLFFFFFFVISRQPSHTSRTLRTGENHTLVYYIIILRTPAKQEIEHATFWWFSIKRPNGTYVFPQTRSFFQDRFCRQPFALDRLFYLITNMPLSLSFHVRSCKQNGPGTQC